MANKAMKGFFVSMLSIMKALMPSAWMLGVVYYNDMHNCLVDYLYLSISLGMKGTQISQLGMWEPMVNLVRKSICNLLSLFEIMVCGILK
jgi:hypothetical protein